MECIAAQRSLEGNYVKWVRDSCSGENRFVCERPQTYDAEMEQGGNSKETILAFSFGLKSGLRFHFDSVTFWNILFNVGSLKPKLKWFFYKPSLNTKMFH